MFKVSLFFCKKAMVVTSDMSQSSWAFPECTSYLCFIQRATAYCVHPPSQVCDVTHYFSKFWVHLCVLQPTLLFLLSLCFLSVFVFLGHHTPLCFKLHFLRPLLWALVISCISPSSGVDSAAWMWNVTLWCMSFKPVCYHACLLFAFLL